MCRFLLLKSKKAVSPKQFLVEFSEMAEKSKAFDGDWQGDGWGFSWLDKKSSWKLYRSLKPVWKDRSTFSSFPKTLFFAIHARSASFPQHKGNIEFNQPYVNNPAIFVFNGYLKGVSLSIPGKIGAEKIWYLLRKTLKEYRPRGDRPLGEKPIEALEQVKNLLKKNTKQIQALNIGYSDGEKIYALSYYTNHPEYYQLRYVKNHDLSLIVSEPMGDYKFHETSPGSILSF